MSSNLTNKKNFGPLFVLLSAAFFSIGGLFIKLAPWHPMAINSARNIFAVAITLLYRRYAGLKFKINKTVLFAALVTFTTSILFVFANKLTTAANAILLQYTAPIFIILAQWLFHKKRPRRLDMLVSGVVFAGVMLFLFDGLKGGSWLGDGLSLLSGVTLATMFLINTSPDAEPSSAFLLGQMFGAISGLPWLVSAGTSGQFTTSAWAGVAVLGIVQLGLGYIMLSIGLKNTAPLSASLISMAEPIFNPIWVAIFYGELVSLLSLAGGVIVIASIIFYNIALAKMAKKSVLPAAPPPEKLEQVE